MENTHHRHGGLYSIIDNKADEITNIQKFKATAVAIRWFGDCLSASQTVPNLHPTDFDLVYLGELRDDMTIDGDKCNIVMTGAAWKAATDAAADAMTNHDNNMRLAK